VDSKVIEIVVEKDSYPVLLGIEWAFDNAVVLKSNVAVHPNLGREICKANIGRFS
jgi:hypothetical protein